VRGIAEFGVDVEPFASVEEAWFWTCSALQARHQGVRQGSAGIKRPCDPDDIILCLERLMRTGQIGAHHARVLGRWGADGVCPSSPYGGGKDQVPWAEAMMLLANGLRAKGILKKEVRRENSPRRRWIAGL
jgi:hypothetical protein